jgi:hypothetical protein
MTTILIIVIGAVLLLGIAARSPSKFHVERALVIETVPEVVYPLVADLHSWSLWSPYEKFDPQMKKTFTGSESGVGAIYEWDGNTKAGSGRIEITQAVPSQLALTLDMFRPIKGHNLVKFIFAETSEGTQVTWTMDGDNSFIAKVAGLFFDMDKMIGKDFEVGLVNLKELVEVPLEEGETAAAPEVLVPHKPE